MNILLHVTDKRGNSVSITADNFNGLQNNLKGVINDLIDLHKEVTQSDELVQRAGSATPPIAKIQTFANAVAELTKDNPNLIDLVDLEKVADMVNSDTKPASTETVLDVVASNTDLDSEGMLWDARIHASSKVKNKDGSWKKRKGASDELIAFVTNEVKSKLHAQTVTVPPAPVIEPVQPVVSKVPKEINLAQAPFGAPPVQLVPQPEVVQPAPVAPALPAAPPVPEPQVTKVSFGLFLQNFAAILTELGNQGKMNAEWVKEKCTKYGVQYLFQVTSDLNKVKGLFADMVAEGLIHETNN